MAQGQVQRACWGPALCVVPAPPSGSRGLCWDHRPSLSILPDLIILSSKWQVRGHVGVCLCILHKNGWHEDLFSLHPRPRREKDTPSFDKQRNWSPWDWCWGGARVGAPLHPIWTPWRQSSALLWTGAESGLPNPRQSLERHERQWQCLMLKGLEANGDLWHLGVF